MDEEVFSNISISPVSISSQFTPATNYTISFTFVFVGEEEGAPLTLIARTADGGMHVHTVVRMYVYLITLPFLTPCSAY